MSESESSSSEAEDEKKDPNYVDWRNMENIRCICRFRPINSREIREEKSAGLTDRPPIISNQGRLVKVCREGARSNAAPMEFFLDKILDTNTTQHNLYLNVGKPMVEACLEGYNTTIFAYGQTGSGKTYTMFGPEKLKSNDELGCVQRSVSCLFQELSERKEQKSVTEYKVLLHFVQLYREKLMDLLQPDNALPLKIRYNPQTDAPYVPNLKQMDVSELGEVIKLLAIANKNRITDKTLMNAESSRSHMIMTLTIEQILKDGTIKSSKLNFADLAGSETYEKALGGTRGSIDRKKVEELKTINLSLTNLTTCINYLSKGRKASYRSSQLTFYLMDSLGGNSKTTLIVAASPHIFNRSETIRALRFAKTAKSVKNKAKVNKELSKAQLAALVKKLQRENKKLKAKLTLFEAELMKNGIELPIESEQSGKKKKHKRAKSTALPKTVLSQVKLTSSTTELLSDLNIIEEHDNNNNNSNDNKPTQLPLKASKSINVSALESVNENTTANHQKRTRPVFGKVDESAYNKLKQQLKSFQDELTQQEDESNILREQLSRKNVELDGLSDELQASRTLSSQFDAIQESKRLLALQLQSKNDELKDIQNAYENEREEYKTEKIMLEEELTETKSDMQQYESVMDNMKLSNKQLKTEVNSLRDTINALQEQMNKKKNKDIKKQEKKNKAELDKNKANEILSKYFTVANTKGIDLNDKQLNDTESKIEQLSQNIIDVTQAYEKFTGQNFSLNPEPELPDEDAKSNPPNAFDINNNNNNTNNKVDNKVDNTVDNKMDNEEHKEAASETEKPKIKKKKTPKTATSLQNRMAMFGGGATKKATKKKRRKSKAKNKIKEYTESIVKQDPKKNLVFQTERLTHYLSSAMTTIDKQKKLHSEELENKISKKNTMITNLSIKNKGLKTKLDRELSVKEREIEELKKEIEDLKLASQNDTISRNMRQSIDEIEEDIFDFNEQIAYLSNIGKGLYDNDNNNNNNNAPVQPQQSHSHNPTQIALWRQQLQIGSKLDCLDEACLWWTSTVTDSDGYRIKVRYDGFDARWDEYVDRGSTRIAPYMTKAKGGRESKGVSVNLKVVAKKKDKRTGRTRRIYKQGFLVKQGKRFKSYKTRYFTLMDDGTMDYFKKMTDQTPAGTFNVNNMIETRRIAYPNKKDLYGFEIVTKERTWRFQAHSDDVVADWIGVIHAVSKGVEPEDDGQQAVIYSGYGINKAIRSISVPNGIANGVNNHKGRDSRGLSIQEESSSHPPINRAAFSQLMDSPGTTPVIATVHEGTSDDYLPDTDLNLNTSNSASNNKSRAEEALPANVAEEDTGHTMDDDHKDKDNEVDNNNEHSGWMHKAGKWDANWTYRYCVLTGEPVTLRCYVSPNKKQTHCIQFKDVKSCIELKKNSNKYGQLEIPTAFAFQLCTSSRIYTFACKSRHEVNVWLKKIRKVVDVSSANAAKYTKRSSIVKFGSTLNKLGTSFGRLIGVTPEHVTTTEVLKTENVQIKKNPIHNNNSRRPTGENLGRLDEWHNINIDKMGIYGISEDRRSSMPILGHWSADENPGHVMTNGNKNIRKKKKGRRKSAPDLRALKNPQYMKDLVNLENEFKDNVSTISSNDLQRKEFETLVGTRHRNTWDRDHAKDSNIKSNINNNNNNNNTRTITENIDNNKNENENENENDASNDSDEEELSEMDT